MKKLYLSAVALLIALGVLLTGCNLITVDPLMQLDEDRAKLDKTYGIVLAKYDGGEVTVGDIMLDFYNTWSYAYQMAQYGYDTIDDARLEQIKQESVGYALERVAHLRQAEERGIALTDAEISEIETDAREGFDGAVETYAAQMDGKTPEVRSAQAAFALYQEGYSYERLVEYLRAQRIAEKLREAMDAEITEVSEDAIRATYDQSVEDGEAYYSSSPESFERDMQGDTLVTWAPEGYRTVKHILVIPDAAALDPYKEKLSEIDALEGELALLEDDLDAAEDDDAGDGNAAAAIRTSIEAVEASIAGAKAELQVLADACIADVQGVLDDIREKIDGGEDFQALIDEYGEDPGMQNEPTRTRGYYVSAESTTWDPAFKNAAMLLENVGDISEPVLGMSGVHLIRYETDVQPGAVPFETVRAELVEDALSEQREESYLAALEMWVGALNPVYQYENWSPADE